MSDTLSNATAGISNWLTGGEDLAMTQDQQVFDQQYLAQDQSNWFQALQNDFTLNSGYLGIRQQDQTTRNQSMVVDTQGKAVMLQMLQNGDISTDEFQKLYGTLATGQVDLNNSNAQATSGYSDRFSAGHSSTQTAQQSVVGQGANFYNQQGQANLLGTQYNGTANLQGTQYSGQAGLMNANANQIGITNNSGANVINAQGLSGSRMINSGTGNSYFLDSSGMGGMGGLGLMGFGGFGGFGGMIGGGVPGGFAGMSPSGGLM
jgi:hypothetical protein